jgi:hypothetical protein
MENKPSEGKKSDKNRLVKYFVEHHDCNAYKEALGKKQQGKGIYILYSDDEVYYVGLSKSSLRSRLRQHHTRDKHKGQWDNYSFFQIRRSIYIKDIETILLRTFKPRGNGVLGKLRSQYNLAKKKPAKKSDTA